MHSQQLATRIYTAHVTGLKTMLKRLHAPVSNKFFIDPAKANWSHVNTIESFTKTVRDIYDMTFNEGKYADFQPANHGGFYEAHRL